MIKNIFLFPITLLVLASASYGENLFSTGTLRTTDHLITIHYGNDGRFYTVKTHDGKVLENQIDEKDLISKMPYLKDVLERGIADDASTSRRYMQRKGPGGGNSWHEIDDY